MAKTVATMPAREKVSTSVIAAKPTTATERPVAMEQVPRQQHRDDDLEPARELVGSFEHSGDAREPGDRR